MDSAELDLVVEFSSMSPSTPGRASGFSRTLRTYSRRVDLVEIGAVRNPYLRREIEERQETFSGALSGPPTQNW